MLSADEEEDEGDPEDILPFVDDTTAEAAILLRGLSSRRTSLLNGMAVLRRLSLRVALLQQPRLVLQQRHHRFEKEGGRWAAKTSQRTLQIGSRKKSVSRSQGAPGI